MLSRFFRRSSPTQAVTPHVQTLLEGVDALIGLAHDNAAVVRAARDAVHPSNRVTFERLAAQLDHAAQDATAARVALLRSAATVDDVLRKARTMQE